MAKSPSNESPSSSRLRQPGTETPPPKAVGPGGKTGSVVDMALPPVPEKERAEGSDIFSPGGRRGSGILSAAVQSRSGTSDLFSGDPSRGSNSDILSAKLKAGESDVLAAMLSGKDSDILAGSSARGSSRFDDPVHATEPISAPVPRPESPRVKLTDNLPDADDAWSDLTDRMPQPDDENEVSDATQEIFLSDDDDFDGNPGRLKLGMGGNPADGDDIFAEKTLSDYDGGGASGVNLLNPGVSATAAAGPASNVNLLNPNVGVTTPAPLVGPASGVLSAGRLNLAGHAKPRGRTKPGASQTKPPSSLITPDDLSRPAGSVGTESSDVFADAGPGSHALGGTRSSILPGSRQHAADAVSFDLPDNRIKQPERLHGYEGSGLIDWSQGGLDSDQLSQRMQSPDDETEMDIDLHDGLMADAAAGKGFTKTAGPASKPSKPEPAVGKNTVAPKARPKPPTRPAEARTTAPRGGLVRGIGIGIVAASFAGVGLYIAGVLSFSQSGTAKNHEMLKQGNLSLRDELTKSEQTLAKTKAQSDTYKSERDRLSTDKIRLGEDKIRLERDNVTWKAQAQEGSKWKDERDQLAAGNKTLTEDLAAAKALAAKSEAAVKERDRQADSARSAVTAAEAKLKAADAAVDSVVAELKSAKLLDPQADRTAALAALPGAVKKAAAWAAGAGGAGDQLADLAKKVADAREEAAKAKADAVAARDAAEANLARAKADAAKTTAALETQVKGLAEARDTAVKQAVHLARTELDAKVAAYEQKLQAQADEFRKDLSSARAGAIASVSDAERRAADRAVKLYGEGLTAYFAGRWGEAEAALAASAEADAADARRWYFLGLARWARGDSEAALAAFRTGAEWEARNAPSPRTVGASLERIQGPARQAIDAIRP